MNILRVCLDNIEFLYDVEKDQYYFLDRPNRLYAVLTSEQSNSILNGEKINIDLLDWLDIKVSDNEKQ